MMDSRIRAIIAGFNRAFKDRKVTNVFMYKGDSYLVEMANGKEDFNNPYYLVNSAGKIRVFSPFEDLEAFGDALDNHKIDISGV